MEQHIKKRALALGADATGITTLPDGRSAIVILKAYTLYHNALSVHEVKSASASVRDYHLEIREILNRLQQELSLAGEIYCDTHELDERALARAAGLGFVGRNTFLIHPELGSAVNIGFLATDQVLACDAPIEGSCGPCRACERACPAHALQEGRLDRSLCLSARSQDKQAEPTDLHGFFYGCDICQRACPYNMVLPRNDAFLFKDTFLDGLTNKEFISWYGQRDFAWIGKKTLIRNIAWNKKEKKNEQRA